MKKIGRMEYVTRRIVTSLISLSMVMLLASAAQAAFNCTSCHGNGTDDAHPVDTPFGSVVSYRNITTGAVKGSHNTHFSKTMTGDVCSRCHGSVAEPSISYQNNHAILSNYSVRMAPSVNYNKGNGVVTSFKQVASPLLGYCSNVNCHFESVNNLGKTPTWGSVVSFESQKTANNDANNTCTKCHAGATLSTDKHPTHVAQYGGTLTACAKCHPNNYAPSGKDAFTHATSSSFSIAMTFAAAPNNGVGTITGQRLAPTFLPSKAISSTATCASLYCHSSGQATPVYVNPGNWSAGAVLNCNGCHGTTNLYGSPDYTSGSAGSATANSHSMHTAAGASTCVSCHSTTVTVAGTDILTAGGLHTNNTREVIKGGSAVFTYAPLTKTCSTVNCHGSGAAPVWGGNTANVACTKCHGKPTLSNYSTTNAWQAAPGYAQAANSGTYTQNVSNTAPYGAHDAHLRATNNYTTRKTLCSDCHGATLPTTVPHTDGIVNIAFSNLAKNIGTSGGSITTGPSTRGTLNSQYISGTCSAIYCHGGNMAGTDTTPEWTFTGTAYLNSYTKDVANCGKCHAALPNVAAKDHTAMPFGTTNCTDCHGHEGNGAKHINGILEASGECNSCHGYQAGSWAAAPTINAEGKGAHEKHIAYLTSHPTTALSPSTDAYGSGLSWTNVCGICHTGGTHQANGVEVSLNTSYKFGTVAMLASYNGTPGTSSATSGKEKTCSNISCHYFTTPVWSTY